MQPEHRTTTHFFTVDVEEYFQVKALESVVSRDEWLSRPTRLAGSIHTLLDCLERHDVRGTFFVLGWLAENRPRVVRDIAAAGHEIASHGFWHRSLTAMKPRQFREDLRSSKLALENATGAQVLGYRAPSFSLVPGGEWAFDALLEEGFTYDSSLFPIHRRGYGYPQALRAPHVIERCGGRLAEFPLATTTLLNYRVPAAGGGYLRHFPLALIRRAFREATSRRQPAVFYIHPWEIDPGQPHLPVSLVNRIRHYRGLDSTLGRTEALLKEFAFGTIASYLPQLGLDAPVKMTARAAS